MKKILVGILIIITALIIVIIKGNTYTIISDVETNNINDIVIELEKNDIVEIKDKRIEDGKLYIEIKSLNKGKDYISAYDLNNKGTSILISPIFVHQFGIITEENFFGNTNAGIIIPLSFLIYLVYLTISTIIKYRKNVKENLYQYKNIRNLGFIIFLIGLIIITSLKLTSYRGLYDLFYFILNSSQSFSVVLLPIAFIVSILVTISNIVLIKKEGKTWKNLLGLILGIFICFGTILPFLISDFVQQNVMSVHNMNGFMYHLDVFIEDFIAIIVTYLECILIGTIIISIKAARKIPEFNKDYILILGCQIRKDGTLTPLLKGRTDRAIEFAKMQKEKTKKDIIFIPSGGKGSDEVISEGLAIKNYLLEQGINEKNIILEDKSKNTYENIRNSYKLMKIKNPNIAYATTNYHVFRAGVIGTEAGIKLEGIGSVTKKYYWINAFIREFIATIVAEKNKHLKIMISIFILSLIMITMIYFGNNL